MTPKELEFITQLIERLAIEVYALGHADGKAQKPLKTSGFVMSKTSLLTLKTNLKKHAEKR